eukprot:748798-Prorocentrum_minimum.AAC.1
MATLQRSDPFYAATARHFEDLGRRYGHPTVVLSLVKSVERHPREMILRREFANAAAYLNTRCPPERQLAFVHWDFSRHVKQRGPGVLAELEVRTAGGRHIHTAPRTIQQVTLA